MLFKNHGASTSFAELNRAASTTISLIDSLINAIPSKGINDKHAPHPLQTHYSKHVCGSSLLHSILIANYWHTAAGVFN